jgi:hypothetical protein
MSRVVYFAQLIGVAGKARGSRQSVLGPAYRHAQKRSRLCRLFVWISSGPRVRNLVDMADDARMNQWWGTLSEDAQAAWCAHAAGQGGITPGMVHAIDPADRDDSHENAWVTPASDVASVEAVEGSWRANDAFAAFIQRKCQH